MRPVIDAAAADAQSLGLLLDGKVVRGIDHRLPPHSRKVRVMGAPVYAQLSRLGERSFS